MTDPDGRPGRRHRVLVGSPALGRLPNARVPEPPAGTIMIDLGEDHPSRAGLVELVLWTDPDDGEENPSEAVIRHCEVIIGALHRGAEKLYEVRDYHQIMMLADRHDWHAPFVGELGVALLCEQQLGIEPPARATWLRTLLAEQSRIASHLAFLGYLHTRLEAPPTQQLRERLRRLTGALTGNRVHPMINRVGGLSVDATGAWLDDTVEAAGAARDLADRLGRAIGSADGHALLDGVAPVPVEVVHDYGISGPTARASGVGADLRRDRPYLGYGELGELLDPHLPVGSATGGDAAARFALLAAEVAQSAALVEACADRLARTPGPTAVKLGKIIRLPEGEGYLATEGPLGRSGFFVVSRGDKTPWRLKLRTPSFNNVAAWERVLLGVRVTSLETALASLGYVVGDLDK